MKAYDKITLIDGKKIVTQNDENAEIVNSFFLSAAKNLRILEFQEIDLLVDKISHSILKAIVKYRNHPSIIAY